MESHALPYASRMTQQQCGVTGQWLGCNVPLSNAVILSAAASPWRHEVEGSLARSAPPRTRKASANRAGDGSMRFAPTAVGTLLTHHDSHSASCHPEQMTAAVGRSRGISHALRTNPLPVGTRQKGRRGFLWQQSGLRRLPDEVRLIPLLQGCLHAAHDLEGVFQVPLLEIGEGIGGYVIVGGRALA